MKVAVIGASGFVGTALAERLLARNDLETDVFIRSYGNAWRLVRAAVPMKTTDVTSLPEITEALKGCTHVVNCTRGSGKVMFGGLKNLLTAAKTNGVKRFIHVSSVAIYGDPPPREAEYEDAAVNPPPGSYGADKLQQDNMVAEAHAAGLDSIIICPPNISGVYSGFVTNVLTDMRNGTFALVDGGTRPNNTVDVDNLAYAIERALVADKGDAKRIFVSDGVGYTWKDFTDALLPLAELSGPLPSIDASVLTPPPAPPKRPASLWRSMKHVVSSDIREALRKDPLWAKFDQRVRKLAAAGGKGIEDKLRHSIEGPRKVAKVYDVNPYSSRYNPMQLRGVWHRIDRARDQLGYEPQLRFDESMARFRVWYETMNGFNEPYWPLVRTLNAA